MTSTERHTFARLLRENIISLCRSNSLLAGSGDKVVQIDAIICVSSANGKNGGERGNGEREAGEDELVVKVHEKILHKENGTSVKSLLFPDQDESGGEELLQNESGGASPSGSDSCDNKRFKDDEKDDENPDEVPDSPVSEIEDDGSSMYGDYSSDHNGSSQYLGKAPFLSSPYHLQKKTPLRSERWTPTMPIPTTPECKACAYTFESFEVLSEHNEAVHSVFTCNNCHKTFTSRSNLERHSRLHTGFKPYVCAICHKAFSRKDHLSNHAAKHAFKCATCNKRFADKKSLNAHHLYEHDIPLSHVCDFCNKGFGNQETYEEHVKTHPQYHAVMQRFHRRSRSATPSPRKLQCPQCSFCARDKMMLLKHCIQHNDGHRSYTCLSCTETFVDPLAYDEHLLLHRAEHNIFECCVCRQVFPTFDILKRHEVIHVQGVEMMNGGGNGASNNNSGSVEEIDLSLPCSHCNKHFPDEGTLHEHLAMHSALVHRCTYCQVAFSSNSELQQHIIELRHYPTESNEANEPTDLSMKSDKHNSRPVTPNRPGSPSRPVTSTPNPEESLNLKKSDETPEKTIPDIPDEDELGSDVEIVEPEAPEEVEEKRAEDQEFKMEPVRSLLGNKLNHDRARKRKAPSPEKFVASPEKLHQVIHVTPPPEKYTPIPAPPPYVEPAMGGYYRPVEPYEIVPQDLSLKQSPQQPPQPPRGSQGGPVMPHGLHPHHHHNYMSALAARAAAAFTEENLRAAHERYRMDLERMERERQERDRYEKLQRDRENQRTPQPSGSNISRSGIDIPPGPQTCSVCNTTFPGGFHDMETHCFVEHNRSPCMFCSKTFAQKANRDRHVCLHTGDKPYGCPDCDERFSRGDKLKLHRVRSHNLQVVEGSGRGRGGAAKDRDRETIVGSGGASGGASGGGGSGWSSPSPSTNQNSRDEWITSTPQTPIQQPVFYKREEAPMEVVHAGGEWSMVTEENGHSSAVTS